MHRNILSVHRTDHETVYPRKMKSVSNENAPVFMMKKSTMLPTSSSARRPLQSLESFVTVNHVEDVRDKDDVLSDAYLPIQQTEAIHMKDFRDDFSSPTIPSPDAPIDFANGINSPVSPNAELRMNRNNVLFSPTTPLQSNNQYFTTPTPFKQKSSDGVISAELRTKMAKIREEEANMSPQFTSRVLGEEFEMSQQPLQTIIQEEITNIVKKKDKKHKDKKKKKKNKKGGSVSFSVSNLPKYTFVTEEQLVKSQMEQKLAKDSEIYNLKTQACRQLHSGQFKEAIDTAIMCLHLTNQDSNGITPDAIYVRILLGEAYTHTGLFHLALDHLNTAKIILDRNLQITDTGVDVTHLQKNKYDGELLLYCMCCYDDIAYLYRLQGNLNKAKQFYEQCLQLKIQVYGDGSPQVSTAYNHLGLVYTSLGHFELAVELFVKALKIRCKVYGEKHMETATVYNNLGNVYLYIGHFERALEHYQLGKHIMEICGSTESNGDTSCHPDLATCYNNIGTVLKSLRRFEDALIYYEKAQTLREKVLGPDHPLTTACFILIGNVYAELTEYNTALEYLLHARSLREQQLQIDKSKKADIQNNIELAQVLCSIASVHSKMNNNKSALEEYNHARSIYQYVYGDSHSEVLQCDESISHLMLVSGRCTEALQILMDIVKHRSEEYGSFHPSIATLYNNIANVYRMQGKFSEALQMYRKSQSIYEKIYGFEHESTATVYINIGNLFLSQKKQLQNALKMYIQAQSIRTKLLGETHIETIQSVRNVALVYYEMKRYDLAYKYGSYCKELLEETLGVDHEETRDAGKFVANVLRESNGSGIVRSKIGKPVLNATRSKVQ
jgi:tetratricopeptide (TPR) repeat protein